MNRTRETLPTTRPSAERPLPKAISAGRDRTQSIAIVLLVGVLVLYASIFGVIAGGEIPGGGAVALVSLGLALLVMSARASSAWGAFWGGLCCFTLTWWTRGVASPLLHSLLPSLAVLIILTSAATRAGRAAKLARGLAERSGGRAASQVLANLGAASLFVSPLGAYAALAVGRPLPVETAVLTVAGLAALAEAAADTVSSELGPLLTGRGGTLLLTTLRPVPRGTDGAISLFGTLSGMAAALLVVAAAVPALHMAWSQAGVAWIAGVVGLFCDSLLGATLERRGWIGNDIVNLTSTGLAGLAAMALLRFQV